MTANETFFVEGMKLEENGPVVYSRQTTPFQELQKQLKEDEGYAWSWHCNIACAIQDVGVDHATSNKAASLFMERLFAITDYQKS